MEELTVEKSQEFAAAFEWLKIYLFTMDWAYAAFLVEKLRERASRQETLMIFNPGYPLAKNDLLRHQAEALNKFVEGIALLKECDELKAKIESASKGAEKIRGMFL